MTFLLLFALAATVSAQTHNWATSEEAFTTTSHTLDDQQARIFDVEMDPALTLLNIKFEVTKGSAITSIEVVSMSDFTTQILDEQILEAGIHTTEFYVPYLETGKYMCVVRCPGWVGAKSFVAEGSAPVTGVQF